ncbi:hypothetical protein BZG36_00603 [Bifiguratus adelaidae]|uniref:Uncharacterized protein n=1 Tax=Bifiguratus adelaidae TaxID=1938954 RepID=A0A261Y7K9_9FUNG|nr:hypothetical protein BZG36_00603 [Bifiguratus adelaidae]
MSHVQVYACGLNSVGQTAWTSPAFKVWKPVLLEGIRRILYASWLLTFGLSVDNQVVYWGQDPVTNESVAPTPIAALAGKAVKTLFHVHERVLCLTVQGDVFLVKLSDKDTSTHLFRRCQDMAVVGNIGLVILCLSTEQGIQWMTFANASTTLYPVQIYPPLHDIATVVGSPSHLVVLTKQGDLYTCGSNRLGQLGRGEVDFKSSDQVFTRIAAHDSTMGQLELQVVETLQSLGATCVSSSAFHTAAIAQGDLYTWGWSDKGRCGVHIMDVDGEKRNLALPQLVNIEPNSTDATGEDIEFLQVSCGEAHTIALDAQGRVFVCGWGKYGQLGRAPPSDQPTPGYLELPRPPDEFYLPIFEPLEPAWISNGKAKVRVVYAGVWNSFIEVELAPH